MSSVGSAAAGVAADSSWDPAALLREPIARRRPSRAYVFGLAIVAGVMLLLPVCYLGLVAAAICGLVWHATHYGAFAVAVGRSRFQFFLFIAPLIVGGVLIFFMVKPLFAPRKRRMEGLALRPEEHPRLFAYVERLCEVVGAPAPREIKVDCEPNASASFRRGWLSLLSGDLRLTIGLPLAAGMTLRQFSGVLAHEFAHFTQAAAMRLTFIVGRVNFWFARVVYERDQWDQQLAEAARSGAGWATVLVWIVQGLIWVTRRILWVLMMIAAAISGFMSRQMEFDADRAEARVAGSEAFAGTFRRIVELGTGTSVAHAQQQYTWRERRLADNLPALILSKADALPDALQEEMRAQLEATRSGWFATHPCVRDRIANAEREEAAGICDSDEPAGVLFNHFDAVCRTLSFVFYKDVLGEAVQRENLITTAALTTEAEQQRSEAESVRRFFGVSFHPCRPLRLPAAALPSGATPKALVGVLVAARRQMGEAAVAAKAGIEAFVETDGPLVALSQAAALRRAKTPFKASEFGLASGTEHEISQAQARLRMKRREADERLRPYEQAVADRIGAGIALLAAPAVVKHVQGAAALAEEAERFVALVRRLAPHLARVAEWRCEAAAWFAAYNALMKNEENTTLAAIVRTRLDEMRSLVCEVRDDLEEAPYPFQHAGAAPSVGRFLVPERPGREDGGAALGALQELTERLPDVFFRGLCRLAAIVSRIEAALKEAAGRRAAGAKRGAEEAAGGMA